MKRISTILGLILCLTSFSWGQSIITARIIEYSNKGDFSRIIVVYETGESEVIPLQPAKIQWPGDKSNEGLIANQKIINEFIHKVESSGYQLVEIAPLSVGETSERFMVFRKKE